MANEKYEIVKVNASDEELEKYRRCFEDDNSPRKIENLKWLHQQNTAGDNIIYNSIDKETGNVAAIYTVMPVPFKLGNQVVKAAQSLDTLTVAEHRGKGLFNKTASTLFNTIPSEGYQLVYGFPNANSAPGFFKKLGWTSFGEVPFLIKPLRLSYFINKLLKRKHASVAEINCTLNCPPVVKIDQGKELKGIKKFDEAYDVLWNEVSPGINVGVNRNSAYMNWRFVNKPDETYYRYGYYENEKLKGIVIFCLKNKHGGKIGYLMELLFNAADLQTGKRLLKFSSKILKQHKAQLILAWSVPGSLTSDCFLKSGYYRFPEKFRPQKLFFGARSLNPQNEQLVNDVSNWYISYADSDTV